MDYFARTSLPASTRRRSRAQPHEADYRALSGADLAQPTTADLAALPLARIEPNRPLPLADAREPAWAAALVRLHDAAVAPLLGTGITSLTPSNWAALGEKLRPYEA